MADMGMHLGAAQENGIPRVTVEQERSAVLTVAGMARDAADARSLLGMLGLDAAAVFRGGR